MSHNFASAARIGMNISALFKPPRRIPVADAVKAYMYVPMGASNALPWEPGLTPYVVEAMNLLASREFDAVIFVSPARAGKTLGLIDGWITYSVTCDPGDMLVVQITQDKAQEHSKKRLARMFRASPEIAKRLSRSRNDNNVHDKIFRDGSFLKIGWPSISIFSSSDYKRVALTDYDRFPEDVDGEGDAFSLASKRTTTFMSAGMTLVESSPGRDITNTKWRRTSPHEAPPCTGIMSLYNRGDRRRWYWPCPHCGEYFQPEMTAMTGFRDELDPVKASEQAHIACPRCAGKITADMKRELNNRGVWLKEGQAISVDGIVTGEPRRSRIASFWMEGPAAAYQTWSQLVYKLLSAEQEYEATDSEEALKSVYNTDWGVPYLPRASVDQRRTDVLMARAEPVLKRCVPEGVLFMVAAVDVQGGKNRRFVVQITGYGRHGERWVVDRYNIRFSLRADENGESQPVNPSAYLEDWQLLRTDVLEKRWLLADESGRTLGVQAMAIDSGGEDGVTGMAYSFWRQCRRDGLGKKVFLFKGDSLTRSKLITETFPDNADRSNRRAQARGDVPLYLLQTNQLKDRISNALARDTPGASYIHIPDWLGEWFYDELTYEERQPDGKWLKPGRGNNEALDLLCYAHALAILLGYEKINWDKPLPKWLRTAQGNSVSPGATSPPVPEKSTQSTKEKQLNDERPATAWPTMNNGGGWV